MVRLLTRFGPSALIITLAGLLLSATLITGQDRRGGRRGTSNQRPERNLQVLPKDISQDQLIATMKGIAKALGVKCGFCHVSRPDDPNEFIFRLDDKGHKLKARVMLRMVGEINSNFMEQIKDNEDHSPEVSCITCHRGKSEPEF